MSPECARWVAEETDLIGIGVETVGTDAGAAHSFDPAFPCHALLLGANKYGLAQLQNLDRLPPTGAMVIAPPLKIVDGSGSPVRVLALVELSSLAVVAQVHGIPFDARISAADGVVFAAGSSLDGSGTDVRRIRIDGDTLTEEGAWSTPGYILDARRTGDRLHVVVVDQPYDLGVIPFEETHVMEHGLYVLEGKAVYRLNRDWVEVEAGDYMWLRAFCPQACYAGGPGRFRYLLYKDVNRLPRLRARPQVHP